MLQALSVRIVLIAVSLVLASTSSAADFSYGPLSKRTKATAIFIRGVITSGDYEKFLAFVEDDVDKFLETKIVVLASPGGELDEAIKISEIVRTTFKFVMVNDRLGKCASACFLIYAAAADRDAAEGSLGIHRPYFSAEKFKELTLSEAEDYQRMLMKGVRTFLEDHEVPQYIIERMFSLASDEVYWLNGNDIETIGRRANWYDQVLVGRCRLDKELERGFNRMGYEYSRLKDALQNMDAAADCADNLTEAESRVNLDRILGKTRQ